MVESGSKSNPLEWKVCGCCYNILTLDTHHAWSFFVRTVPSLRYCAPLFFLPDLDINDILDLDQERHASGGDFVGAVNGLEASLGRRQSTTTRTSAAVPANKEFFPGQLHQLLEQSSLYGYDDIVHWLPHGRSFIVRKPKQFLQKVVPLFFRMTSLPAFNRQLCHYGFIRKRGRVDKGSYYHPLFLRGRRDLADLMKRRSTGESRMQVEPEEEPNFYDMAPLITITAAVAPISRLPILAPSYTNVVTKGHHSPPGFQNPVLIPSDNSFVDRFEPFGLGLPAVGPVKETFQQAVTGVNSEDSVYIGYSLSSWQEEKSQEAQLKHESLKLFQDIWWDAAV